MIARCPARSGIIWPSPTHWGTTIGGDGQTIRHISDHIDLPPNPPVVTQIRIFDRGFSGCRRMRGTLPETMPAGSPFGRSITAMLAYLHHCPFTSCSR
jgi:transposase